jgi:tetratricopeptide (TPR) repeat protein
MKPPPPPKSRRSAVRRAFWALLVVGFVAVAGVQRQIDRQTDMYAKISEVLYVRTGNTLRKLCLGNEGLMADIYWTRVVQYFGRGHLEGAQSRYELLAPLLRITTDLDPQLIIAYRFGAIFLMARRPVGAGDPQSALQLIRRGIVANPDYWRFWQDLGFVYYWEFHDYKKASEMFEVGSQRPGAPFWLKGLAGTVAAKGGDLQTSRFLWSEVYRHADTDAVRNTAEAHLATLKARVDMDKVDDLLEVYRKKTGHPAQSIYDLYSSGLLKSVPKDPSGVAYVIGPDGRAALGQGSKIDLHLLQ